MYLVFVFHEFFFLNCVGKFSINISKDQGNIQILSNRLLAMTQNFAMEKKIETKMNSWWIQIGKVKTRLKKIEPVFVVQFHEILANK